MLRPIKRPSNRLIPAGEQLAAFILVHRGRIQRIAPPELLQLLAAVPHTGRESGKIACAERGRFADDRTANRAVRNIALELHQEAVAAGTTVHRKGGEGSAGIAFHGGWTLVRRG